MVNFDLSYFVTQLALTAGIAFVGFLIFLLKIIVNKIKNKNPESAIASKIEKQIEKLEVLKTKMENAKAANEVGKTVVTTPTAEQEKASL